MKLPALLSALALSLSVFAQTPYSIESVEYDPGQNRWFVSNGNSTMLYTFDGGNSWNYFGNASANYGMEVAGNYLYAISNGSIVCYDLFSGSVVDTENIMGSSFLNGMGSHGNTLVVSDFSAGRLVKIDISDPSNMQSSTLVANTGTTPNGVVIDADGSRAVVVNWGSNADILGVDIATGEVTTLVDGSGLGNCDGIDIDSEGNYYVSSWSPARITKFSPDFSSSEIVVSSGLSSPADISYSIETDTLGVANSGNNQVTFHSFANTESVIEFVDNSSWVELFGDKLVFNLTEGGNYQLRSYLINGQIAGFIELSLLPGETNVELDKLPKSFTEGGIIAISKEGDMQKSTSIKYFN